MATVKILPPALEDLERLAEFLRESDPEAAAQVPALIFNALRVLADHPLIGRPAASRRRELVIFRGRSGYIVQYAYSPEIDEVLVLAVRHQREIDD